MQNIQILQVTATFLNTFGYVGVSLLLLALAYYLQRSKAMVPFYLVGGFGVAFLLIFGSLDVITRVSPNLIITRTPLLIGRVNGATQTEQITLAADDSGNMREEHPFLRRENDAANIGLANHLFIFSKTTGLTCVLLNVVRLDSRDTDGTFFGVPIASAPEPSKPDDELLVRLGRTPDHHTTAKYAWYRGTTQVTAQADAELLPPLSNECPPDTKPPAIRTGFLQWLLPKANAQDFTKKMYERSQLPAMLNSTDPFVRRGAKQSIAMDRETAPSVIPDLLHSDNKGDRIGGLDAIAMMPPTSRASLSPDVWSQVQMLRKDGDDGVRWAAERAASER